MSPNTARTNLDAAAEDLGRAIVSAMQTEEIPVGVAMPAFSVMGMLYYADTHAAFLDDDEAQDLKETAADMTQQIREAIQAATEARQ